ncbi:MAG: hypothetical protein V4516_17770 [Pseudomonadota bacterium]
MTAQAIDPAMIRTAIDQARQSSRQIGELGAANARMIRTLETALNQSIKGVLKDPSTVAPALPNTAAFTGQEGHPTLCPIRNCLTSSSLASAR